MHPRTHRSGHLVLDAVPGRDAGVTAASIAGRLSKLEAQLSHAAVRQDETAGSTQQLSILQVCVCTRKCFACECVWVFCFSSVQQYEMAG